MACHCVKKEGCTTLALEEFYTFAKDKLLTRQTDSPTFKHTDLDKIPLSEVSVHAHISSQPICFTVKALTFSSVLRDGFRMSLAAVEVAR